VIKINLALRKQSSSMMAEKTSAGFNFGGGSAALNGLAGKLNLEVLKGLPIKKLVVPLVTAIVASYALELYKDEEIKKKDDEIAQLEQQKTALSAEAAKMKEYEAIKKQLEADELVLRTKIDVVRKLVEDRGNPPKILLTVAKSIPKDAWLTEFKISEKDVSINGMSIGDVPASTFAHSLGESAYFSDATPKKNDVSSDDPKLYVFELTAKRR
jgi:Tfp pilus assembly protein PilN